MAPQLSIDVSKTAVLVMDYQKRQLSEFSEEFQREIIVRGSNQGIILIPQLGASEFY